MIAEIVIRLKEENVVTGVIAVLMLMNGFGLGILFVEQTKKR